jgi:hypothetical protein
MNYLTTILVHIGAYSISFLFFFLAHFYEVILLELEDLLDRACSLFLQPVLSPVCSNGNHDE